MARAGISQSLAGEMAGALGVTALAVGPWIAAAAGFLTGTNVASNAMLVPMQAALAAMLAIDPRWFLALQNVAGANFTLLSPIRVAIGAALDHLTRKPAPSRRAVDEKFGEWHPRIGHERRHRNGETEAYYARLQHPAAPDHQGHDSADERSKLHQDHANLLSLPSDNNLGYNETDKLGSIGNLSP